jgi:hypothetical protein
MSLPRWPKVTLFDDPDEELRVEAMRDALRNGTFDEAEPYLGTPPGFATLITNPPRVPRRYDSHGLESEDDGSGPFDGLKRYAEATRENAFPVRDVPTSVPIEVRSAEEPYLRYDQAFPRPNPKPVPPPPDMPTDGPYGPATMNQHLFPKRQQGPVSHGIKTGANESVGQVVGGVNDVVYNTLKSLDPIVELLEEKVGHLPRYNHPRFKEAETAGGAFIRDVSAALTEDFLASRAIKAIGFGGLAAEAGEGFVSGSISNPREGDSFANLVEKYPELSNPITRFLASDPTDPEALARLKKGLNGAIETIIEDRAEKGLEKLAAKYGPSIKEALRDGIAHAVTLLGHAERAGQTVEELVRKALRSRAPSRTLHERGPHSKGGNQEHDLKTDPSDTP